MRECFERFWAYASKVVAWTNIWLAPTSLFVMKLTHGAGANPGIARDLANGFASPPDLHPWDFNAHAAAAYLKRMSNLY